MEGCLTGRRAGGRVWLVTGTYSRGTRWPGGSPCQWGEGILCDSVHLQPVSKFWQSHDVWPAIASQQPAVMRVKFKLGKRWVEMQSRTWCCVDVQGISGSHPNRIWEYCMDMSETGFGIWTVYLGEVKVRAHQKVQLNYRVSCLAKWVIFCRFNTREHGNTSTSESNIIPKQLYLLFDLHPEVGPFIATMQDLKF